MTMETTQYTASTPAERELDQLAEVAFTRAKEQADVGGNPERHYGAGHAYRHAANILRENYASAPEGDWLWQKLMEICRRRGAFPASYNDLFEIVGQARASQAGEDREGNSRGAEACS